MTEHQHNVYQDEKNPDDRQTHLSTLPTDSRFRPRYRNLTAEEKSLHDTIKATASHLEALYNNVPDGREKSLAMTKLEESIMWIVKGLTA